MTTSQERQSGVPPAGVVAEVPTVTLAIDHCPRHGFYSVSLNETSANGWGSGRRLTPSKCCGSWKTFREWTMSVRELRDIANEAEELAAKLEAAAPAEALLKTPEGA